MAQLKYRAILAAVGLVIGWELGNGIAPPGIQHASPDLANVFMGSKKSPTGRVLSRALGITKA